MFRIYGDVQSGNCYKIKLLMSYLTIPHEWVDINILSGETQTDEFFAKNPNGKVPVLEISGGKYMAESNAILNYLAEGTEYLPVDRWERAQVLQWQFFEQYSHEPYIAVARFIAKYLGMPEERRKDFESKYEGAIKALNIMEKHLSRESYFVANRLTIADISLYAYTHVAHEGGFSLSGYPAITNWLSLVESHPYHISMAQAAI